jgi:hypothetical protein
LSKVLTTYLIIPIVFVSVSLAAAIPIKAQDEKDIEIHKLQTNLRLYDEALSELQAPTPEETALVYAKGVKVRNGVMQYSVISNKLKEEFRKRMGNGIWVTGVSSPWVSDYKIISRKRSAGVHKITVKFNWATSAGPAGDTKEELTITKENGKWSIMNIRQVT